MRKLFSTFIVVLICSITTYAQQFTDLSQLIPRDPDIRKGVLPNGLTYYIKKNQSPKKRVSYYIYQNVGAVLETEKQNGLAHFLEHMAFNGTKTFPGNQLIDELSNHGVKFGREINAYTTQNETVYNISKVPSGNEELTDTCLKILRDWCNYLSLKTEDIDAERGVITEERRTRRNSSSRIREKIGPVVYNGTIYGYRDVIGSLDVIQNFHPDTLRSFYHDWYRTDLQAIGIVGDVNVDEIEQKIKALFSEIPAVKNPKKRPFIKIPDNKEPMFVLGLDSEARKSKITFAMRRKNVEDKTLNKMRRNYVQSFFNFLMRARINEQLQKGNAPFFGGSVKVTGIVRGYSALKVSATAKKGREAEALEGVYKEYERVRQHGFTATELERLKKNFLVSSENKFKRKDQVSNDAIGKALKTDYLTGNVVTSADFDYQFAKFIIPTITLQEVSAIADHWKTDHNWTISITGPENNSIHINKEEALTVIENVENSKLDAYEDNVLGDQELIASLPKGGTVIKEKQLAEFKAVEWTLSNGAKVVFKHADHDKNRVELIGVSEGGLSRYKPIDLPSASNAARFTKNYGLGAYDKLEYKKLMTGVSAGSKVSIGSYSESISAWSTPEDFEQMMQLTYLRFEKPRFDEVMYNNLMKRNYENLATSKKSVQNIMNDTLGYINSQGNPRVLKFGKKYLDDISFDRMKQIYLERFTDASDFIFFIVGNVKESEAKQLAATYIGAIKNLDRKDHWIDHKVRSPKGKHFKEITLPMTDDKSTVMIKMKSKSEYTRENIIYHSILKSILELRFTKNIREKEGGTYGVRVSSGVQRIPNEIKLMTIKFDCDPSKANYLKSLVYDEFKAVQKNVNAEELNKIVLNLKKNNEQTKNHNSYWMSALQTYYKTGFIRNSASYFDNIVNSVTPKDIKNAARRFFRKADVIDVIFNPQKKKKQHN
tara:strand:- start:11019 stop:13841 length:2823 start_codon:yes stop_codon:yes gene_type:complete